MKTNKNSISILGLSLVVVLFLNACTGPALTIKSANKNTPVSYGNSKDTGNVANMKWRNFFTDANLVALIDTALQNNQELNIMMQEISIAKNEARARKGEYLPFVNLITGAGLEKPGLYTSKGASDDYHEIAPGKKIPEPLTDLAIGAHFSWEIDAWKKLRNYQKSAVNRYLATVDGRNFMVTQLIAEIAHSYYELMALDNQLDIIKKNIEIYQQSLEIVKLQKSAARVTELAVKRFEAELLSNQSNQYYIEQQIIETENRINFLVGRFPQKVNRDANAFANISVDDMAYGIPSQLLENRPDIKQAERLLQAAKLDVKATKAEFYPSIRITAATGFNAFNQKYLFNTPQSIAYNLAADLVAPLINRNAIKAAYYNANARQIQAVYNYERSILNGHVEVVNLLSNMSNLKKSYELKSQQVAALNESIDIASILFKAARADYMEVLLTQRDALESRIELVETKKLQLNAKVSLYKALGGGWN